VVDYLLSVLGCIILVFCIVFYVVMLLWLIFKFLMEYVICRKRDACKKGSCIYHEQCHRSVMTDAQREELDLILKEIEAMEKLKKLKKDSETLGGTN